jgi:recombination protein RecT
VLRHRLEEYRPIIARLLAPTGVDDATFVAWIANATRERPEAWAKVEPETLLGAALRCAQIGLPPNDGTSLAWIIPYGREATFQLGYGGVLELARRAVPGLRFEGRPVFPGDLFKLNHADVAGFQHVPYMARRRPRGGDAIAWYVLATWPNGDRQIHVLDREQVEYHRGFSKQPNGDLWTKSYDAAALKSVVLDMRRWLPHTPELARAIGADGAAVDVRDMADEAEDLAAIEAPEPEP